MTRREGKEEREGKGKRRGKGREAVWLEDGRDDIEKCNSYP